MCVLNDSAAFIEQHKVQFKDADDSEGVEIKPKEKINQDMIDEIRLAYIKSRALQIYAASEAKRIHALIKSASAKLKVFWL